MLFGFCGYAALPLALRGLGGTAIKPPRASGKRRHPAWAISGAKRNKRQDVERNSRLCPTSLFNASSLGHCSATRRGGSRSRRALPGYPGPPGRPCRGDALSGSNRPAGGPQRCRGRLDSAGHRPAPGLCRGTLQSGQCFQGPGQLEQAVAAYRQAIALRPYFAEVHHDLGIALGQMGQLDQAIAAFRQAVAIKPDFATPISILPFPCRRKGVSTQTSPLTGEPGIDGRLAQVHYRLGISWRTKANWTRPSPDYGRRLPSMLLCRGLTVILALPLAKAGDSMKRSPSFARRLSSILPRRRLTAISATP